MRSINQINQDIEAMLDISNDEIDNVKLKIYNCARTYYLLFKHDVNYLSKLYWIGVNLIRFMNNLNDPSIKKTHLYHSQVIYVKSLEYLLCLEPTKLI